MQRLRDPFRRQPEDKLPHDLVVNADIFVEDRHFFPGSFQAVPGLCNDVTLDAQYLDVAKVFVFDDLLQPQFDGVVVVSDDIVGERLGDEMRQLRAANTGFSQYVFSLGLKRQPAAERQRDEQGGEQDERHLLAYAKVKNVTQ